MISLLFTRTGGIIAVIAVIVILLFGAYLKIRSDAFSEAELKSLKATQEQLQERDKINDDVNQSDPCDLARELGLSVCD